MMHNKDLNERFRFTMTVDVKGQMGFSSIGLHTLPELIGYLRAVCHDLERRMVAGPHNLITDMTDVRQKL